MKFKLIIVWLITFMIVFISWPVNELKVHLKPEVNLISVEVKGAVAFPKKYQLLETHNLSNLIDMAGGLHPDANISSIDFEMNIRSEDTIYIPFLYGEVENVPLRININEATYEMLLAIPGMTENRAANVILYRSENGNFRQIEELMNVKYIKEATFEKIRPYVYV